MQNITLLCARTLQTQTTVLSMTAYVHNVDKKHGAQNNSGLLVLEF